MIHAANWLRQIVASKSNPAPGTLAAFWKWFASSSTMNRLPLVLGKLSGVLLVAVGVLVGLIGLFCTVGIAVEWQQLGRLTESDRNGGLACAGLTIAGVLVLWAGVVLLRKCGIKYTPAPSYNPISTPQEAEAVLLALAKREQPATATSTTLAFLLLAGSLAAFVAVGRLRWSRSYVAVLVGALLFHEGGHYVAMRAFGYRNLRMFFIPLFGAAVSGLNPRAAGWQKALVALAGPLPGIMMGAVLIWVAPWSGEHALLVRQAAIVLLSLNAFNLLPLFPLDGGRFLYEVLFCRHALLRTGFLLLTGGALVALGIQSDLRPMQFFGGMVIVGAFAAVRQDRVIRRLKANGVQLLTPSADLAGEKFICPEALPPLLDALKADRQRRSQRVLVTEALAVIDQLRTQPPKWATTLNLLALYGTSVAVALVFLLPILSHRSWHFHQSNLGTTQQRLEVQASHLHRVAATAAD